MDEWGATVPLGACDRRGSHRRRRWISGHRSAYDGSKIGHLNGFQVHANISKVVRIHIEPWTVLKKWSPRGVGAWSDIQLIEPLASDI
ncbi:hypothetical protein [Burkholderia ubonensis]|uniref:hypothetical protein n=1 Tax=Burkholderia ubonensis TaxID=101571 RepID=UPI000AA37EDC|nr:hypothetical protein [Burkholderia ubonensis]